MEILTQGPLNLLQRLSRELDREGIAFEILTSPGSTSR